MNKYLNNKENKIPKRKSRYRTKSHKVQQTKKTDNEATIEVKIDQTSLISYYKSFIALNYFVKIFYVFCK